jgi:hypothetical protein
LVLGVLVGCDRGDERDQGPASAALSASSASVGASASAAEPPPSPPPPPIDAAAVAKQVSSSCTAGKAAAIFSSPAEPSPDGAVRLMATTHETGALGLVIVPPGGAPTAPAAEERLGPPRSLFASVSGAPAGKLRVIMVRDGQAVGCRDIEVKTRPTPEQRAFGGRPWKLERAWDKDTEDLYSAWIEKLFDVKESEPLSVPALHELTRDPARNFLFDHLGLGEDEAAPKGLRLDPDCADLPYTLRAYFAFKMGLPFAFSSCTRGTRENAPRCLKRASSLDKIDDAPRERVRRMDRFVRVRLADTVHSGTGRTKADDDFTDYYPIALSRETLRPGAIFADPYGHILVVARRVPQTADRAGALFAIDGQPDGTVAKKRFWQGNFLFSTAEPSMGSPGFKRFRPVVVMGDDLVTLDNAQITADPAYGDFSMAQATMDERAFYDAMDDLLSPQPLDPERAMAEAVRALHEQAEARVTSVENGEKHFREGGGRIEMPDGAAIFETTGDWEDFSTPSRDLRLLIAIDVVTGFPALVGRRPERFRMPTGQTKDSIVAALEATLQKSLRDAKLTYSRSDASPFTITLADLVARKRELEVAYHPDDCPEVRWGAPAGSDEIATCRRRATGGDRAKMERKFRGWFRDRRRPPRGG